MCVCSHRDSFELFYSAGGPWTLGWHGPTKTHPSCRENVPAWCTWAHYKTQLVATLLPFCKVLASSADLRATTSPCRSVVGLRFGPPFLMKTSRIPWFVLVPLGVGARRVPPVDPLNGGLSLSPLPGDVSAQSGSWEHLPFSLFSFLSLSLSFLLFFLSSPSSLGVPGCFRHSWELFLFGVSLDACAVAGNTFASFSPSFSFSSSSLPSLPSRVRIYKQSRLLQQVSQ